MAVDKTCLCPMYKRCGTCWHTGYKWKPEPHGLTPAQNETYKNLRANSIEIKPVAYYPDGTVVFELTSKYGWDRDQNHNAILRRVLPNGVALIG